MGWVEFVECCWQGPVGLCSDAHHKWLAQAQAHICPTHKATGHPRPNTSPAVLVAAATEHTRAPTP